MTDNNGWLPIDTLRDSEEYKTGQFLVFSPKIGQQMANGGAVPDLPYAYVGISGYHGNAIKSWGVTHWRPMLPNPEEQK
jgi:hypothetical protein